MSTLSHASQAPRMHPYSSLTPDLVVEAIEAVGHASDGRVLALNSYENRVYQVGGTTTSVVVKFYRPGRWTTDAILEEHDFALELARAEIPVVAPEVHAGRTLYELGGFRYAVYPRQGGRWPELGTKDDRAWMGRFLARIHAVGRTRAFRHRPRLDRRAMGRETADYLLDHGWIPPHLVAAYESLDGARAGPRRTTLCGSRRRIERCGCTATAIPATCSGPTGARTSWTSTTA